MRPHESAEFYLETSPVFLSPVPRLAFPLSRPEYLSPGLALILLLGLWPENSRARIPRLARNFRTHPLPGGTGLAEGKRNNLLRGPLQERLAQHPADSARLARFSGIRHSPHRRACGAVPDRSSHF